MVVNIRDIKGTLVKFLLNTSKTTFERVDFFPTEILWKGLPPVPNVNDRSQGNQFTKLFEFFRNKSQ